MNREEKQTSRSVLFRHLDGIAIGPTVATLYESKICEYMLNNPHFTFTDISNKFASNNGYLNVALRLLASQAWLNRKIVKDGKEIDYILTDKGKNLLKMAHHYVPFVQYIPTLIKMDQFLFSTEVQTKNNDFAKLIANLEGLKSKHDNSTKQEWEIIKHLEGLLAGPIIVALGMSDILSKFLINRDEIDQNIINTFPMIKTVIKFFIMLKWIRDEHFTEEGLFFMKRAVAYGVTVSYLPTFMQIPELLFGNPNKIWKRTPNGLETHVNRRMNVWGSGGAHSLYFRKIDKIIIHIFNQPIEHQPIGIADMGCGDGTMLEHLYNVIITTTLRGKVLDKYPLKIIGADFNKAARLASSITLKEAGIEHSILAGDISDPSAYAQNLKDQFGLDLRQMLNVRSFLDHNRIYSPPKKLYQDRICQSTGAFVFRGRWIPNNELKQNLVEHFSKWAKYVNKYGLLILELHTIDPALAAANLGTTVATAYDGTHGYSDQYIFEVDTVLSSAKEAGLQIDPQYQARFPNDELATISINLFRSNMN